MQVNMHKTSNCCGETKVKRGRNLLLEFHLKGLKIGAKHNTYRGCTLKKRIRKAVPRSNQKSQVSHSKQFHMTESVKF